MDALERSDAELDQFIDKNVKSHNLDLRGLRSWLMKHRWQIVNILTQGDYQVRLDADKPACNPAGEQRNG